jgi:hypothetical protein
MNDEINNETIDKTNNETNDKINNETTDKTNNETNDKTNNETNDKTNNKMNCETNDKINNGMNCETNNKTNYEIKDDKIKDETNDEIDDENYKNVETNDEIDDKMNVMESIKTNYLSWIVIILSVMTVSYPSIGAGFITFFICLFSSYFVHSFSHNNKNILTIIHHYHHDNDNFFSHFSQILIELSLSSIIFLLNYLSEKYFKYNYVDIWSGLAFVLFYSTVHNYNYGQLRINNVHYLHHVNMFTNIGPDICDVAFGTKNNINKEVENTNHYIPNLILSSIFILFIKYLCTNENIKFYLSNAFVIIMTLIISFLSASSIYLYQKT